LWGLYCCPDIDLVLHASAGQIDPYRRAASNGGSYECFETIRKLGMPSWLRISDRDLATHLVRSHILRDGGTLEDATGQLAERFGLGITLMPPTNDPVRTTVVTPAAEMGGLQYMASPERFTDASGVSYRGAEKARAIPTAIESILGAERIILAPADPLFGLGPILAVPDLRQALARTRAGVIAVSPLIGSQPVRGGDYPLMNTSGETGAKVVRLAEHLKGLVDCMVIHTSDVSALDAVRAKGIDAWVDNVVLESREEAARLAARLLFSERVVTRMR
jgi:LPPG:FO 2-phospho-L-lactate transferase